MSNSRQPGNRSVTWAQRRMRTPAFWYSKPAKVPPSNRRSTPLQLVEVEVNTSTGEVTVIKMTTAVDAGRVINPKNLEGQLEGGMDMGVGFALREEYIDGQTKDWVSFKFPTIGHSFEMETVIRETPRTKGPLGSNGSRRDDAGSYGAGCHECDCQRMRRSCAAPARNTGQSSCRPGWHKRIDPLVALTAMGKPLFKAPDGGYYEIVRVTEDSTRVDSSKGLKPPCLLNKRFAPKPSTRQRIIFVMTGISPKGSTEWLAHVRMVEKFIQYPGVEYYGSGRPSRPRIKILMTRKCARSRTMRLPSTQTVFFGTLASGTKRWRRLAKETGLIALNETQWRILKFLREYYFQNGRSPLNRQIREHRDKPDGDGSAIPRWHQIRRPRLAGLPNPKSCN